MSRFPLLNIYRTALQIFAGLTLLAGLFVAYSAGSNANDYGDFSLVTFVGVYTGVITTAIGLLVTAELIHLGLSIEDHLHAMRHHQQHEVAIQAVPTRVSPAREAHETAMQAYRRQLYEEAVRLFNRALELDPNYAITYRYRALAYQQLGEMERAQADMDTYSRLS